MVTISKSISSKIKDKQGDITEDEVCLSNIYSFESTLEIILQVQIIHMTFGI